MEAILFLKLGQITIRLAFLVGMLQWKQPYNRLFDSRVGRKNKGVKDEVQKKKKKK